MEFTLMILAVFLLQVAAATSKVSIGTGTDWLNKARSSFSSKQYEEAAFQAMQAIALGYNPVHEAFVVVEESHRALGDMNGAYVALGKAYLNQGSIDTGISVLNQVIDAQRHGALSQKQKETLAEAHYLLSEYGPKAKQGLHLEHAIVLDSKNPVYIYTAGNLFFTLREFELALQFFRKAFDLNPGLRHAYANIVYLETRVMDWSMYVENMQNLERMIQGALTERESVTATNDNMIQSLFVDPHMLLAYPMDPGLKLRVARDVSVFEARKLFSAENRKSFKHLPTDFNRSDRIRVGFLSADFKLKATSYLVQHMFQYFDRARFQVYCFANTQNSEEALREELGLDFRAVIESGVEHFVDVSKLDVHQLANELHDKYKIHILVDFDGYSNNGIRAEGIFHYQAAPIQVSMLVYVGTTGNPSIQYVVTDPIASPLSHEKYFSEKFLYLPHSFFVNSHAHIGRLQSASNNAKQYNGGVFRMCNFNKHLKITPQVFKIWCDTMELLREKDISSELLLLEFPKASIPRVEKYMNTFYPSLRPVKFLPFENSPIKHQKRIAQHCDVVVDNPVYNAHTMAVDTLWGGTPLLVWGNGHDFGGRVGESMLRQLGIPELIAQNEHEYQQILQRLATDQAFYDLICEKLRAAQDSAQLNAFWDTKRYVENLQHGFQLIWETFMNGEQAKHTFVRKLVQRDEL